MCDASDYAAGAVLGQRADKKPIVIFYASKTFSEAQMNYTTTKKEFLAVVFALDKFRSYIWGHSKNYNAKLSDFGLTKDGPADGQSHVSTRIMGKLLEEYEILEAMELPLFFFSTLAYSIGGFNKIRVCGHSVWPVAIYGYFADTGDSAAQLSGALNVPMLFTGHSLGRDKAKLLREKILTKDEISTTYKIISRIEAEEMSLDMSEVVISCTRQDIDKRWC
nr:sucrose-phosphate synthase [Tanacetum cinerariifolium]